jgi:hypothetical protein
LFFAIDRTTSTYKTRNRVGRTETKADNKRETKTEIKTDTKNNTSDLFVIPASTDNSAS